MHFFEILDSGPVASLTSNAPSMISRAREILKEVLRLAKDLSDVRDFYREGNINDIDEFVRIPKYVRQTKRYSEDFEELGEEAEILME